MKPASDFEGIRAFCKLFFTLGVSINGLLDSGGGVLVKENLIQQIAKLHFLLPARYKKRIPFIIRSQFSIFFTTILKPRIHKQQSKDLKQNPLAPTSMAYRSTLRHLKFITDFNCIYWSYDHTSFPYSPNKDRSTQSLSPFWLN